MLKRSNFSNVTIYDHFPTYVQWTFILSALLVIGAGVWFYFISESNRVMTYPAVVLLGWGFSAMAVNSLAFATQLIGPNKVSN